MLLGVVSELVMLALSVVYSLFYLGEASLKKTRSLGLSPSRTPATDLQELSQSFRGHLLALGVFEVAFLLLFVPFLGGLTKETSVTVPTKLP